MKFRRFLSRRAALVGLLAFTCLASNDPGFITGSTLSANGGQYLA